MNVKVSRARLIAAIDAKRSAAITEHREKAALESANFAAYKAGVLEVIDATRSAVKSARSVGDITRTLRYGRELKGLPDQPEAVGKPNTARFDDALAKLALVEDETITLNERKDADFLGLV